MRVTHASEAQPVPLNGPSHNIYALQRAPGPMAVAVDFGDGYGTVGMAAGLCGVYMCTDVHTINVY